MATSQKVLSTTSTNVVVVWPENKNRKYLVIQNQSNADILISFGSSPSTGMGYKVAAGDEYAPANPPTGEIRVVGTTGAATIQNFYSAEE